MATQKAGQTGYERLWDGFVRGASNLAGVMVGLRKSVFMGLSVTRRDEFDYLATVRVWDVENHETVVAFGNGPDPIAALMSLNGAVTKGKYTKDKFSRGNVPDWKVVPLEKGLPSGGQNVSRETPPPDVAEV